MKCNAPVDPETKIALKGDELKAALKDPAAPRCGCELYADDIFCPSCGARCMHTLMATLRTGGCEQGKTECDAISQGLEEASRAFGFCVRTVIFVASLAAISGIIVWSVYLSSTVGLIVLLLVLLAAVKASAESMVEMFKAAFLGIDKDISSVKKDALRWVCIILLCIPLSPVAYGFIQGGIESMNHIDKGKKKINLITYFVNKRQMNVLTRIGYRWIYHICWDFKGAEDRVLDTSGPGLLSLISESLSDAPGTDVADGDRSPPKGESQLRLGLKISTALMKENYAEARRLAGQISDKDMREFQLANIAEAESLKKSYEKSMSDLKKFKEMYEGF